MRFSVRPEKIRLLDDGDAPEPGAHAETGQIREVVYAGAATRYVVDLDDGGALVVSRQNLETTSAQALATRGTTVRLEWRREHVLVLDDSNRGGRMKNGRRVRWFAIPALAAVLATAAACGGGDDDRTGPEPRASFRAGR